MAAAGANVSEVPDSAKKAAAGANVLDGIKVAKGLPIQIPKWT